jgi:fibro-slime domain-containing protein
LKGRKAIRDRVARGNIFDDPDRSTLTARNAKKSMNRSFQPARILALASIAVGLLSHAASARTLMFLVDWWLNQPMDTVINLTVSQPSEVVYLPGGTPPAPKKSTAYVSPSYEQFAWWYSLPNFTPDDYSMGRIRVNTLYQRGWYQMDSTYTVKTDTVLNLSKVRMDTATKFTYRNPATQRDTTINVTPATATTPASVTLPAGATFRGPKLYTSQGNGGTPLLNTRPTTSTGGQGMGSIDKCLDSLVGDTVWIRFIPAGQQQPTEASMRCTNYNPFAALRARVYLRSPWPGSSPTVQWNGQEIQMYPWPSNPDFMYADLRYLPTQAQPPLSFRFHKSQGSAEYFDSAGTGSGTVKPFSYSTTANNGSYWFVAPEGGAPLVAQSGTAPLKPLYLLYIQNPWNPGTPRVVWENDPYLRVMRPTDYCGWYKYPLYSQPVKAIVGHSFEDSLYTTAGVSFRTRANWVTLQLRTTDNTYWIQTKVGTSTVRGPAFSTTSPATSACGTDTLKLVMEAFDFKGRGDAGGNSAFQVGGAGDNTGSASSGLVKGMVQTNLGANGLPVYTGRDSGYQAGGINGQGKGIATGGPFGKSTPSNWFDSTLLRQAVPGIAIGHTCLELPLVKTPTDSGYYKYNNQSFFPLDTITDRRGYSLLTAADNQQHNFLFCLHGHAAFEYTPGLKFEFRGDDDVWVFINKKLSVDLGGTHSPESSYVDIDKLHLVEGQVYPFDIFYCERQTNGSSILIRTSMDLQPSWQYKDTIVTGTAGLVQLQIRGQKSQNYRPSCADLTSGPAQWTNVSGRIVVVGPDGSDLYAIYNNDTTLYGGYLSFLGGLLKADTTNLVKSPDLGWPGQYKILLQSKVGDPLDSVVFTKKYGAVTVQGRVIDANGDGIADSIRYVAPMPIFKDASSIRAAWYTQAGLADSVVLVPTAAQVNRIGDSLVDVSISGKSWGERTAFPAGKSGAIGAIVTSQSGTLVTNPVNLVDGIAPVADSAYLKYDTTGSGSDTLWVWTSEGLVTGATGSTLPATYLYPALGGASSRMRGLSAGTVAANPTVLQFVFPSGTAPVGAGDSIRLGGTVSDAGGNTPGLLSKWVPLRTNNVAKSWMLDVNGDGRPDSVGIGATGDFTKATAVKVNWKTAQGADTSVNVPLTGGLGSGLRLPSGILGNATYCSGCTIEVTLPSGVRRFPLFDSVAPVATQASYKYGKTMDTLFVTASETLTTGAGAGEGWVAQKALGSTSIPGTLVVGTQTGAPTNQVVLLVAPGTFTADSVRLRGWAMDAYGNAPGTRSRFVEVEYGMQPIRVQVYDRNGDGLADSVVYRLTRGSKSNLAPTGFGLTWGGTTLTATSLVRSTDSLSWSGAIGPFPLATAPASGDQGWLSTADDPNSNSAAAEDSVPPVAIWAGLNYGGGGGRPDTLDLMASEDLAAVDPAGLLAFVNSDSGEVGALSALRVQTVFQTAPNRFRILVDSGSIPENALWARLGTSILDSKGNVVGANSRWVTIQFGLRMAIRQINPVLNNAGDGAWPEPDPGTPPTEFQVRGDAGGTWYRVEDNPTIDGSGKIAGGTPTQLDSSRVMAVYLRLNRPLEGDVFVYDNMGTGVLHRNLDALKDLWPAGWESALREVRITWNGTDPRGKFVASGVYLMRVVVKVDLGGGQVAYRNLVWKYGWHRPAE